MDKKLLFITYSNFPANSAMFVRQFSIAKIYQLLGWDVLVLTRGELNNKEIRYYKGIAYLSVSSSNSPLGKVLSRSLEMESELKRLLKKNLFNAIHLAGASTKILKMLKEFHKKNPEVILTHDSVEWYSPEQFKLGVLSMEYRKKNYWMTKGLLEDFNIIAISSYLQDYFTNKGINTVRIPVVMDISNIEHSKKQPGEKCKIVYAGSPGKKDYLSEIVESCRLLNEEQRKKLKIYIIGVTEKQLISQCGVKVETFSSIKDIISCMGRKSREQVIEELQKADFTILIRPENARYAKAGFPTKIVESLATGTPVICNITSDLGEYLIDGENSLIIKERTIKEISEVFIRAISLDENKKIEMSYQARKTAENNFDYKLYVNSLEKFLQKSRK